jgi:hypothetical protein
MPHSGVLALLLCLAIWLAPAGAGAATVGPFVALNGPGGVAIAGDGSLFVTYDGVGDVRVAKLTPAGQLVNEVRFGNLGSTGQIGHLAIDPATGVVFDLLTNGTIKLFDPQTLQSIDFLDLRQLAIDRGAVFDVSQGGPRDMSGSIVPSLSTYGDVALLRRGAQLDLLATGRSSSGVPFVARLRILNNNQLVSARAIAAASISNQFDNVVRGVAVNAAGTVLTTLPTPTVTLDAPDRAYAFGVDYPEAGPGAAPRVVADGADLSSRGIDTDAAGNFYVTGSLGSTRCGVNAAGSIAVVGPEGGFRVCHPFALVGRMEDVAVSPDASLAYTSLPGYPGAIYRWTALAPPPLPPAAAPGALAGPAPAGPGPQPRPVPRIVARPPRAARLTPRELARLLGPELTAAARAFGRLGLGQLLSSGGLTLRDVDVPAPGALTITATAVGARPRTTARRGARPAARAAARRTVVLRGRRSVSRAGAYRVRARLTRRGRRLLRGSNGPVGLRIALRFETRAGVAAVRRGTVRLR